MPQKGSQPYWKNAQPIFADGKPTRSCAAQHISCSAIGAGVFFATMKSTLITSALFFGLMACGGSDSSTPVTANTQSATATVSSTGNLRMAITGMQGNGAAAALNATGSAAQTIVQPQAATQRITETLANVIAMATKPELANAAPGDCICDANGCTFDQCGMGTGFVTNGSITKSGDTYTFDVDMVVSSAGIEYTWAYAGMLTITETLIDGTLGADGSGTLSSAGINYTFNWDVTYNDVTLDTSGCAIGGTMDASAAYSISNSPGGYNGSVSVAFGPACGTVTEQ